MRLWLDDERPMPLDFDRHAKTAEEAISLLSSGIVSHIDFDHDLGEGKTGYDVACWIELQARLNSFPRIAWRVHSANSVGAERIRIVMRQLDQYWSQIGS